MDFIIDFIKVLLLSIVEGVTEFLPISSTGHLILVNEFLSLKDPTFSNAFNIIIQLGAIFAIVLIYFKKLNPWSKEKMKRPRAYNQWNWQTRTYWTIKHFDQKTMALWGKVLIGVIPAGVLGILLDDYIDAKLMNRQVVTATLLIYGVLIILVEEWNKKRQKIQIHQTEEINYKTAFLIGCFQCLAMVPGTSRSAATIIGGMLLGLSRTPAAEFSFFIAIPTMLGATLLKIIKNIAGFSAYQWFLILLGFLFLFLWPIWSSRSF